MDAMLTIFVIFVDAILETYVGTPLRGRNADHLLILVELLYKRYK